MESDTVHWHTDDCHIRNSASFPVPEFHHTIPDPLLSKKVSLFAESIVNTGVLDIKIIFPDTKMTHCYFIFNFRDFSATVCCTIPAEP